MQNVLPKYDLAEVNAAGKALVTSDPQDGLITFEKLESQLHTYDVVNNWRACHSRPLNTFAMTLRNRALHIHKGAVIAQRIKRLDSISKKLTLQSSMKLSQMQDIAGCRAILPSIQHVRELEDRYRTATDFSHDLKSGKDYIAQPKASGYRSVHLIYRFKLREQSPYENQQVEIQMRSQLQHTWATAVEAAGTFTNQALKSSQGSLEWQRFFSLMGSYIAHMEGCPLVPGTPTDVVRLRHDIRVLVSSLHVIGILKAYSATLNQVGKMAKMKYYLMDLDPDQLSVRLTAYMAGQTKTANDAYIETEKSIPANSNRQVVLVSVDSVQALRQAYPNYFLDTTKFASLVQDVISQDSDSSYFSK